MENKRTVLPKTPFKIITKYGNVYDVYAKAYKKDEYIITIDGKAYDLDYTKETVLDMLNNEDWVLLESKIVGGKLLV